MKAVWVCVLVMLSMPTCCRARASDRDVLIVEDIQCRGNVSTSCEFIRGHLYLAAGGQLDEDEVRNAKLRLSALRNFKSVDIHLEKGSERRHVIVVIVVAEADPFATAYLFGTSFRSNSQIQTLAARLSDDNVFHAGKVLDLLLVGDLSISGTAAKEFATRLEYFDPQLFGLSTT